MPSFPAAISHSLRIWHVPLLISGLEFLISPLPWTSDWLLSPPAQGYLTFPQFQILVYLRSRLVPAVERLSFLRFQIVTFLQSQPVVALAIAASARAQSVNQTHSGLSLPHRLSAQLLLPLFPAVAHFLQWQTSNSFLSLLRLRWLNRLFLQAQLSAQRGSQAAPAIWLSVGCIILPLIQHETLPQSQPVLSPELSLVLRSRFLTFLQAQSSRLIRLLTFAQPATKPRHRSWL